MTTIRSTTIVAMCRDGHAAIAGDGQVTFGEHTVMKQSAKKVRRLHHGRILAGFAGAAADAFSLFDKFEGKVEAFQGNLLRAAVELAKEWRTDRVLRRLEALLVVVNTENVLVISGTGDVIEPDDGIAAVGSGGAYALAAARALARYTDFTPPEICRKALEIAADICIYTNDRITVEEIR